MDFQEIPEPSFTLGQLEETIISRLEKHTIAFHRLEVYRDVKEEFELFVTNPDGFSDNRKIILKGNLVQARDALWSVYDTGCEDLAFHFFYMGMIKAGYGYSDGVEEELSAGDPTSKSAWQARRRNMVVRKYISATERAISKVLDTIQS